MKKNSFFKHIDFFVMDFILIEIAYYLACSLRYFELRAQDILERYVVISIYIAVVFFMISIFWNIYSGILRRNRYDELKSVIAITSGVFVALTSFFFMRKVSMDYSRVVLFSFYFFSTGLLFVSRILRKEYLRKRGNMNEGKYLAFVTKDSDITKSRINGMRFNGVVTIEETKDRYFQNVPIVANKSNFKDYIRNNNVECVYFYTDESVMNEFLNFLILKDVVVYRSLLELSRASFRYSVQSLNNNYTLRVRNQELPIGQLVCKRLVDILGAIVGIILTSPIMLITAICIKASDGGPVLYVSKRVGLNGKEIDVLKFRSMKVNADKLENLLSPEELNRYYKEYKLDNDPRVTKIGNFIRKYSIDEIPQFFNVLRGDMSFIGPRPVMESETQLYGDKRDLLLSLKPGITGYWQAYGRNNITYESGRRQAMELYYIEHFSLLFDIRIFFRTFVAVLTKDGAQ